MVGRVTEVDETFGEQHVGHRHQQVRVGAGSHGHVLVGLLGGAREAGVDHDDLAAARLDRLHPAGEVGRGAERAVGFPRVGTEHDQVVGAVEVGHGDQQRAAEEQPARHVLGHLVDGAGREHVGRAERLGDGAVVEDAGQRVGGRVAEVQRHRRPSVRVDDRSQPRATSANASSQPTSSHVAVAGSSPRRTSGARRRSGSSCSCFKVEPLGQMNPRLNGLSRSPRMRATSSPRIVISSPHAASHSGHDRKCVVVSVPSALAASVMPRSYDPNDSGHLCPSFRPVFVPSFLGRRPGWGRIRPGGAAGGRGRRR